MRLKFAVIIAVCSFQIALHGSSAKSSIIDSTYVACDDLLENGPWKADLSGYRIIAGSAVAIEYGVRQTFRRLEIDESTLRKPNWDQIMLKACELVVENQSVESSYDVFQKAVFDQLFKK